MSLSTTNITTTLVSQTLGFASNDVGTLVASTSSGGIGGYAFYIAENNNGTTTDGTLLPSSLPKWNIYSNNSPGEWKLSAFVQNKIEFKLKRSIYDSNRYDFSLGSFRGYNHSAITPILNAQSADIGQNTGSGTYNKGFSINCNLGEYDWTKVSSSASKVKVVITRDIGGDVAATTVLNNIGTGTISFSSPILITGSTTAYGTYTFTQQIAICDSSGNVIFYLPISSKITINIYKVVPSVLNATIGGVTTQISKGSYTFNIQSGYVTQSYAVGTTMAINKTLRQIIYNLYDSNSGTLVSTATYTTFGNYDKPTTIASITSGTPILFSAQWDTNRLYPTAKQYVVINMFYS